MVCTVQGTFVTFEVHIPWILVLRLMCKFVAKLSDRNPESHPSSAVVTVTNFNPQMTQKILQKKVKKKNLLRQPRSVLKINTQKEHLSNYSICRGEKQNKLLNCNKRRRKAIKEVKQRAGVIEKQFRASRMSTHDTSINDCLKT